MRWLEAFPSFGYVLAVRPDAAAQVVERFHRNGIACADVGGVEPGHALRLRLQGDVATLWDLAAEPFIGVAPAAALHLAERAA
jgi:hypothetical protein